MFNWKAMASGVLVAAVAQAADKCSEAAGRSQEGCFKGARATTASKDEKVFLMRACELNTQVILKDCREGVLAPPSSGSSACEAAIAYAGLQKDIQGLALTERVKALASEGGGFGFPAKNLLKKMTTIAEPRRKALLGMLRSNASRWFSGVGTAGDGEACFIAEEATHQD